MTASYLLPAVVTFTPDEMARYREMAKEDAQECKTCGGSGIVVNGPFGMLGPENYHESDCRNCRGRGYVVRHVTHPRVSVSDVTEDEMAKDDADELAWESRAGR